MSLYTRSFAFLKPYWLRITTASLSALLYSVFSALLIWMLGPLMMALFDVSSGVNPLRSPGEQVYQNGSIPVVTQPDSIAAASNPLASSTLPSTMPSSTVDGAIPGVGALTEIKESIKAGVEYLVEADTALDTLFNFGLLIIFIVVAKNAFNYLQRFHMAFVQESVARDLRNTIFEKYQKLSFDYFHTQRTGSLMSRVTNDVLILNQSLDVGFNHLVSDVSLVALLGGFLLIISWKLTLMAMVTLPILVWFIYFIGKKIRKYSGRTQERMADITTVLEENISNMRLVKAFGAEEREIGKFHSATNRYFKALLKMVRVRHLSSPINDTLASIVGVVLLMFAGSAVMTGSGDMDASDFFVFIVAMFSLIKPAKSLSTIHARLQEGMAAAERVFSAIDTEPKIIEAPAAISLRGFRDKITYQNVCFEYIPGGNVLSDVSFDVRRGEVVALVGPSGGGKSTLVDLLPRFYDPQGGSVSIDGEDIRNVTLGSLRALMGIVTQETFLFNDTVRGNILYGVESASEDEIIQAASAAHAHGFIMELPEKYETKVGARGVRLSGGQRQRLAIARALLRNPDILIFDEATSALDTESEHHVQEAINNLMKNRTALVIAHRLSTIRNADRIITIDRGRVVEMGTHEELLKVGGLYSRLYNMQFRKLETIA
ncbi:MAG: ABC transporter ATP-binding protein [candidate division Zixibacteria bacterium]|nr:ABC transporter ATP-binding protein [candidate division Zixibacteria bacterium]